MNIYSHRRIHLPEPRKAVKKSNPSLKAVMSSVVEGCRTDIKFSNLALYIATGAQRGTTL